MDVGYKEFLQLRFHIRNETALTFNGSTLFHRLCFFDML